MKLSKNVILSVEILVAHKLRTFLSVVGIVVGIASVILMVAAGQGAQQRILDRIRNMGANLIVVNAGQTHIIAGRQRQMTTVRTLTEADAEAIIKECPSVTFVAPAVSKKMTVHWGDETANQDDLIIVSLGTAMRRLINVTYVGSIYSRSASA